MSNTVLFGKVKDAELMVYNFRGQLQCRMGGKREGPIGTYPKLWNLNPLTAGGQEILRIPAWKNSFELVKRELEAIMEKEILPTTIPEFPTVRRMTLGMNSPLVVPSIFARRQQKNCRRGSVMAGIPCSLATLQQVMSGLNCPAECQAACLLPSSRREGPLFSYLFR